MDINKMCRELCEAERDRLTTTEICIDEALTTMDRHGMTMADPVYRSLKDLSYVFHDALKIVDGYEKRIERIVRVRKALTEAFPLSDDDLARTA